MSGSAGQTPVAIVGIGCRFPGGVVDPASFWRLLSDGIDAITPTPPDRFAIDRYFDPRPATPGRVMTRWGGFLDRIDEFDAAFFGIAPREAERIDPQQRLVLETAWEALEDAGQDAARLDGSPTGVFIGQWMNDFESRLFADPEAVDFFAANGGGRYSTSGRLSYALGLRGPSLTVDTACSSSLVAIHLAVRSIRSGESTLALAGGVNVILQPQITIAYSQSRMMAPDGRCKFGDASGDGYVRSEGVGIVLLKPLPQALADGDRIYAVIRGSAANNDGHSSGSMSTPSRIGQEELLRRAYADAAVNPGSVGLVEAHGTGTRAGDPVELAALAAVLREGRDPRQTAYIGSVKTNFGHTEAAAGVAGLIKLALSLYHRQIPRSLHFKEPNPAIPWAELPLVMATERVAWPAQAGARIGGVNAFGVSGTNAHVVLEEPPQPAVAAAPEHETPALLVLSARSPQALRDMAQRYHDLLVEHSHLALRDVCWSAATRRSALEHRAAFVAATRDDLCESLRTYASGDASDVVHGHVTPGSQRTAFVCPGHGAQWVGMARDLIRDEPVFRTAIAECDAAARRYVTWSVMEQIHAERDDPHFLMDRVDVVQPVLLSVTIAYARLMMEMGVVPDALVGHSMGEASAAYLAGVLDLDAAMRITCRRSHFMQRTAGEGAMALIDLPMEQVQARLNAAGIAETVTIGVVNSPRSCVVSGEPGAIRELIATLERESVFCRLVKVDVASHSAQMDPVAAALVSELAGLHQAQERTPLYSTLLGRRAGADEFTAEYWGRNIRDTVLLGPTIGRMLDDGLTLFVEIGPHPVVLPSVEQTANALGKRIATLAVARRDQPERLAWLRAVGTLWCAGHHINWRAVFHGAGNTVRLPSYPWQRERLWAEAAELSVTGRPATRATRPDASTLAWLHQLQWKPVEADASSPASAGPVLVVGDGEDAKALVTAFAGDGIRAAAVARSEFGADAVREPHGSVVYLVADDEGADAPIRVAQVLLAARSEPPARVWFVTRGAQVVNGSDGPVSVRLAAFWGAARVVAEEHPDWWGGLIDLEPRQSFGGAAARIVAEVSRCGADDQIAFRGDARFVLRLMALARQMPPGAPVECRSDAAYLVTGGLGDVGLHLARALAANGAKRLVLAGRTPLPRRETWARLSADDPAFRRVAAIRELEAQGVAMHVAAFDVSDARQLEAFVEQYTAEAWPPIAGVVHAAGTLDNRLVRDMDGAAFERVTRPKIDGARNLDRLFPDVDFFVLCSSTGAFLAQPGQANYAAANAGMDALAENRRLRGKHALSIQWGIWQDTGLVKGKAGERSVEELARQGVRAFTPEQGVALFGWLLGTSHATAAVLPIDWSTYARTRRGRREGLFAAVFADIARNGTLAADTDASRAQTDPAKARERLESIVREAVAHVLKIAPSRLDARKALGEMGLNSLMAMELRNRLETALGRSLSATVAWNHPTVDALVQYLAGDAERTASAALPADGAAPDVSDSLRAVSALSDEDAALALRSRI